MESRKNNEGTFAMTQVPSYRNLGEKALGHLVQQSVKIGFQIIRRMGINLKDGMEEAM